MVVGRSRERAQLAEAVDAAGGGSGAFVVLSGPAGIGKSALAGWTARRAVERGALVLKGRAWEASEAPLYWPWVQLLRRLVRKPPGRAALERLGEAKALVERLLPGRPAGGSLGTGGSDERFAMFDAVASFLASAADETPLLLLLEDMHSADDESLMLLRFVAREVGDLPLVLLATFRAPHPGRTGASASVLSETVREAAVVHLMGLQEDEVADLIEQEERLRPSAEVASTIWRRTGGNPLFAKAIARSLADRSLLGRPALPAGLPLPWEVQAAIRQQLAPLPASVRGVLDTAAVVGTDFPAAPLAVAGDGDLDEVTAWLRTAEAAGIVEARDERARLFAFAHALIRETIYFDLPERRRRCLHRDVAAALERSHAPNLHSHVAAIAHHHLSSLPDGDAERALSYGLAAAREAVSSLAFDEAVRRYQRVLDVVELEHRVRAELLVEMGTAAAKGGMLERARAAFGEAGELAATLAEPDLLAAAALGYAGPHELLLLTVDERCVSSLEAALSAVPQHDLKTRSQLVARLASTSLARGDVGRAVDLSAKAFKLASDSGHQGAVVDVLRARLLILEISGHDGERLEAARKLVAAVKSLGDREQAMWAQGFLVGVLLVSGETAAAERELLAFEDLERVCGLAAGRYFSRMWRSTIAALRANVADARRLALEAARTWVGDVRTRERSEAKQLFGAIRGTRDLLEPRAQVVRICSGDRFELRHYLNLHVVALFFAESGELEAARDSVEEIDRLRRRSGLAEWVARGLLVCEALVAVRLGDAPRAERVYSELLPHAGRPGFVGEQLFVEPASAALGALAAVLGRREDAARHFESAIGEAERMGARRALASALLGLGNAYLARGEPGDGALARRALDRALTVANDVGLDALADEIHAALSGTAEVGRAEGRERREVAVLRRDGELWTVAHGGREFRLKNTKGLCYLAKLLTEPKREFHALDMVGTEVAAVGGARPEPLLDPAAKRAYALKLADLREEIEEAEGWGDGLRAERARAQLEAIAAEVARSVGLGGRDREASSAAERARSSVGKAIKSAIERIEREAPSLGWELRAAVQTGFYCSYRPQPEGREWRVPSASG